MSEPMDPDEAARREISDWLADAFTCAGIEAATTVDEALIGDIENWHPIGILAALEEAEDV